MAQVPLAWSPQDFITAPIVGSVSIKNVEDLISKHFPFLMKQRDINKMEQAVLGLN